MKAGKSKRKGKKSSPRQRRQRPTRAEIQERRRRYQARQKALRERELADSLQKATNPSLPNRVSGYADKAEEAAERESTCVAFIDAIRTQLPGLLAGLAEIKDWRNPKRVKHQMTLVLFYGILCFVLQAGSRRECNRDLTGPLLREHLQALFPELETLPHHDTVNRILAQIDVEQLQEVHLQMIRRLIRNKKFDRFLVNGRYPIAIDGTQKMVRQELPSPEWQERVFNRDEENEQTQYYVYVLEASLAFANGMTIPLLCEFLDYAKGDQANNKQDCETKAFHRLAARLKEAFPRLPILILLDGLYPNGPIFATCRKHNWQFMIVLQDSCLPTVWQDFKGLLKAAPENQASRRWGNRRQHFRWANDIEYCYGDGGKNRVVVHVVECTEQWQEVDPKTGETVTKTSRHAWVSSVPLTKTNLHERCNLAARHRWNIEEQLLVEKRQGYNYEHCFSTNWNAMKGYHYLMHLGHALNVLVQYSEALVQAVKQKGVRGFIKFMRDTLLHPWLEPNRFKELWAPSPQLRLA